jgi:hypothetical protein
MERLTAEFGIDLTYNSALQENKEGFAPMNFDRATISYPDGRVEQVSPAEFYSIPLGTRIELLTAGRMKFEKDKQIISPLDALKKK